MGYLQVVTNVAHSAHHPAGLGQLELSDAELRRLGQLGNPDWLAEQATAHQENIHQALVETERVARRVAATLADDPFAAAVVAHSWKLAIRGIAAVSFTTFVEKRSWHDATQILDIAIEHARSDAARSDLVDRYLRAIDDWNSLRAPVGDRCDAHVAQASSAKCTAAERVGRTRTWSLLAGGIAAAATLLAFVTAGALVVASAVAAVGACAILGVQGRAWRQARTHVAAAAERLAVARRQASDYRSFMASPQGGVFLVRMWSTHPLLLREPASEASGVYATPAQRTAGRRQAAR